MVSLQINIYLLRQFNYMKIIIVFLLFITLPLQAKVGDNSKIEILKLQQQIDSLKNTKALDELKYRAIEHQEVINQVNDFYDKSWNSLLWLIGVLVAIFGLILPIISQLISASNQRKNLKELTDSLSVQLTETFNQKITLLEDANNNQISKLQDDFSQKTSELEQLGIRINNIQGGISYLFKGVTDLEIGQHINSVYHIAFAINFFIDAINYQEVNSALMHLKNSLTYLENREELEHINRTLIDFHKKDIDQLILFLKNSDNYLLLIKNIREVEIELDRINSINSN